MAKTGRQDMRQDIRRYALIGAEQRLVELQTEAAQIVRAFPELRRRGQRVEAPGDSAAGGNSGRTTRRRRVLSADARKRISDAQKARWAKHRSEASAKAADGRKKK
jgi:hypothetical protein